MIEDWRKRCDYLLDTGYFGGYDMGKGEEEECKKVSAGVICKVHRGGSSASDSNDIPPEDGIYS